MSEVRTETNRIVVSGASGVGKSLWINPVEEKLREHGYTVESPRIHVMRASDDWLQDVYNHREVKRCRARFCLIEVVIRKPAAGHNF